MLHLDSERDEVRSVGNRGRWLYVVDHGAWRKKRRRQGVSVSVTILCFCKEICNGIDYEVQLRDGRKL